jgi:signal transduction histidine kinase
VRSLLARSRRHLGWPLLLLAAGLGATGVAAWRAHRAARDHRVTAERLVREHAAFAAWSYARHAEEAVGEVVWMVVNPILHRHLHPWSDQFPDAYDLIEYHAVSLERCECTVAARPRSFFAFQLGADTVGTAGAPASSALRRWVNDTLTAHLRTAGERRERAALVAGTVDGGPVLLGYGLMPMTRGDTIVYAFAVDPATVGPLFERSLADGSLLPSTVTQGLANDTILAVRVVAPGGAVLYESRGWPGTGYVADDVLRPAAAGLVVRTAVRPALADRLLIGGMPSGRPPLLVLVLLAVAVGVMLVGARQLRREEELARARADFVASVSHELRTPLAQIRLFLETLRLRRYSTDAQREWLLGHLDRETMRLSALVENVLAFARSERQRGRDASASAEVVELAGETTEAARAFGPLADARGATLRLDLEPGLGARIDRAAFRRLVFNLLDNAVKYGPVGGEVTLRLARAGDRVRLTIADEGPGIAREERERIWEPFVRGAHPAVQAVGGSGIGLAIVREIAERLGGTVAFADDVERGACVALDLPLVPLPASGMDTPVPATTAGAATGAPAA